MAISEAFKLKYDNIFAKLMNISVDELHFDKLKLNESICVNENAWQKHKTPESICKQMIDLYSFNSDDKILVLFNLELVKELISRKVKKENIYFVSDYSFKSEFLFKYFKEINYINLNEYTLNDLEEKIKSFNVKKFDVVFSNPPYEKNLHLKIINNIFNYTNSMVIIHPARWIQDPLADYKKISDKKRYSNLVKSITYAKLISSNAASKIFNIASPMDLMIAKYEKSNNKNYEIRLGISEIEERILNKILNYSLSNNIKMRQEKNKVDGIRIKSVFIMHGSPRESSRKDACNIFYSSDEPLINGYNSKNIFWSNITSQSKGKTLLPLSIRFDSVIEAQNYLDSLKTNFMKNLIKIMMWDMSVPNNFLPWMEDYKECWTDKRFCEFFKFSKEETEFMCKNV